MTSKVLSPLPSDSSVKDKNVKAISAQPDDSLKKIAYNVLDAKIHDTSRPLNDRRNDLITFFEESIKAKKLSERTGQAVNVPTINEDGKIVGGIYKNGQTVEANPARGIDSARMREAFTSKTLPDLANNFNLKSAMSANKLYDAHDGRPAKPMQHAPQGIPPKSEYMSDIPANIPGHVPSVPKKERNTAPIDRMSALGKLSVNENQNNSYGHDLDIAD